MLIGDLGGAPRRRKQLLPAMTAHRGALCVATGAALLLLAALPGCRLAHKESRWSEAMRDWAHLAEAQAAAWWAVHRPAAVAALPPRPPAAPHARAGLSRPLAQPLTVMLQLPDHRELQLREDETLESLVAKLLQEQVGAEAANKGWLAGTLSSTNTVQRPACPSRGAASDPGSSCQ